MTDEKNRESSQRFLEAHNWNLSESVASFLQMTNEVVPSAAGAQANQPSSRPAVIRKTIWRSSFYALTDFFLLRSFLYAISFLILIPQARPHLPRRSSRDPSTSNQRNRRANRTFLQYPLNFVIQSLRRTLGILGFGIRAVGM